MVKNRERIRLAGFVGVGTRCVGKRGRRMRCRFRSAKNLQARDLVVGAMVLLFTMCIRAKRFHKLLLQFHLVSLRWADHGPCPGRAAWDPAPNRLQHNAVNAGGVNRGLGLVRQRIPIWVLRLELVDVLCVLHRTQGYCRTLFHPRQRPQYALELADPPKTIWPASSRTRHRNADY